MFKVCYVVVHGETLLDLTENLKKAVNDMDLGKDQVISVCPDGKPEHDEDGLMCTYLVFFKSE